MTDVQGHIGRREVQHDVADARRMAGLAVLLDHDAPPWKAGMPPPPDPGFGHRPGQIAPLAEGRPPALLFLQLAIYRLTVEMTKM